MTLHVIILLLQSFEGHSKLRFRIIFHPRWKLESSKSQSWYFKLRVFQRKLEMKTIALRIRQKDDEYAKKLCRKGANTVNKLRFQPLYRFATNTALSRNHGIGDV